MWVQIFVLMYAFTSVGYILRRETDVSYGDAIFNFWENCQTIFQNACPIFTIPPARVGFQFVHICTIRFPISPHQYQNFLSFLVTAISVDIKRHLIVVFMSICVVINDTGLFIVYLLWNNVWLNPLFKKGFIFLFKNHNFCLLSFV